MKNEGGERVGREYGEKGERDGEVTCLEVWGSLHGCMEGNAWIYVGHYGGGTS